MIQSYIILEARTNKVLHKHEFIEDTLDEEVIGDFLKSMQGILTTAFGEKTVPSEFAIRKGNTFYTFRWGDRLVAVLLSNLESKLYSTRLTETIHEIESGLTDVFSDLLNDEPLPETAIPHISTIVLKNFQDLVFFPIDDIGSVDRLLKKPDDYFVHTGIEGAASYEERKKSAALRNFVGSYEEITFEALDELISILRSDLVTVNELQKRLRLLDLKDLAITLRQLLRLNIMQIFSRPKGEMGLEER
ncbi:MAG: hypothetical protein ACFFC7_07100 [Candidatus Hermodarchaeota archaeon]